MRTTLKLDDRLLKEAKKIAAESGRTLASVVEELLREALARRHQRAAQRRVRLPVFRGRGLRPGVDLDRSADLLDLMEDPDAASGR